MCGYVKRMLLGYGGFWSLGVFGFVLFYSMFYIYLGLGVFKFLF